MEVLSVLYLGQGILPPPYSNYLRHTTDKDKKTNL